MPFVPAARILCVVCNKTVYVNEQVKLNEDTYYHATCFKCHHCSKVISSSNFAQYNGVIYCKPHFLALFKQRGKYDDLAGDAATKTRPAAVSVSSVEQKQESLTSPTAGRRGGAKKDLVSVLRTRNAQAVQALIESKGLGIIFKTGADGVSPLELAFTTNNSECGRVMLKAIEDALTTGQFAMEKPDDESKEEASSPPAAAKPIVEAPAPTPVVVQPEPEPVPVPAAVHAEPVPEPEPAVVHAEPAPAPAPEPEPAPAVAEPEPVPAAPQEAAAPVFDPVSESKQVEAAPEVQKAELAESTPSYLKGTEEQGWLESPMQAPEAQKVFEDLLANH